VTVYGVCATGGWVETGAGPRPCVVDELGNVIATGIPVGFELNVNVESFEGFGSANEPVVGNVVFVNADPVEHGVYVGVVVATGVGVGVGPVVIVPPPPPPPPHETRASERTSAEARAVKAVVMKSERSR